MPEVRHLLYEFGGFQLDPARYTVLRQGDPVALAPKLFETLVLLVQNRGRVLEKEELIRALWPDTFVEEGNLSQNIFLLRKFLGDDRNGHSFIHTVPRKGYEFIAAVTEIVETTPAAGPRIAEYWRQHSPFRGLQAFEPEDAWLFFGRDAEINDLLSRLRRSPVVAMVGNSGSGKSSLLGAGLIPALRIGRFCQKSSGADSNGSVEVSSAASWRIAIVRPSAAPFDYLAEVLPSQLAPELSIREQAEFIAECRGKLPAGDDALRNAVSALVLAATDKTEKARQTPVLLVVDQFEEIFTLTSKRGTRDRYINGLLAAARTDSAVPVHLVLALRADFYGHCLDHPALSRCLETNLYNVPRMTAEQMRETIEKRLQLAGGQAEPGLVDSLLEDVGAEPGNLALLEHALDQLWERCRSTGCTLTNIAYAEIGRLRGALGRHADGVYQSLADENQKRLAQKIFLELVHLGDGAQDTRRRVPKAELLDLGEPEAMEALLARLATARLIATGREGEQTFVEVSHEALIREWPALREWLEENREDLALERRFTQAVEEWRSLNRDPGALLQGARLVQAEEWLSRQGANPQLREYVDAGIAARTEATRKQVEVQQREARRSRWFSGLLVILLLCALALASWAYHRQSLEKTRTMAAQAEELAVTDHGRALALALRSWEKAKTDEARTAVASTFPVPLLTLNHDGQIRRVVFSPDGQRILSASRDHTARLWRASDGHLLAVLKHGDNVEYADFSGDGKRIVTASEDNTARIWDGLDGHLRAVLKGHVDALHRARFSPDGKLVATAPWHDVVHIWNSEDGRLLLVLKADTQVGQVDVSFSPDGQRIVTASDQIAQVWNVTDGRLLATLQGHSQRVNCAEFSPDGLSILTCSKDATARLWNSSDGRLLHTFQHQADVVQALFSPDGSRVVTASLDHTARVWSSSDGSLLATLRHNGPVADVSFSPDNRHVATASYDHTARLWNRDGGLLAIVKGHMQEVLRVSFSPSGDQVVTGGNDRTVRTWNLRAGLLMAAVDHEASIRAGALSPDRKWIATSGDDHTVRLWNTSDGSLRFELKGHSDKIWNIAFSPDSQRVVSSSSDKTARIWSTANGSLLAVLRGHTDMIANASFSPDGQQVLTASSDMTARLWDARNGHLLAVLQDDNWVFQARFSPDGQRIVTSSNDRTARIWSSSDQHVIATLKGHGRAVFNAAFSPDGEKIVTAGNDGTARVWTKDGRLLWILRPHEQAVFFAFFSHDSRRIFTDGMDGKGRVWSADNGKLVSTLLGHTGSILYAEFSGDDQRIVTASEDLTVRVWNAADGNLLAMLQGHASTVQSAFFAGDQRIVTIGLDQARVWEILTLDDIERILSK